MFYFLNLLLYNVTAIYIVLCHKYYTMLLKLFTVKWFYSVYWNKIVMSWTNDGNLLFDREWTDDANYERA